MTTPHRTRRPAGRRHQRSSSLWISSRIPTITGAGVLIAVAIVLTGWLIDFLPFKTLFITQIRVKPNNAVALGASALALLLLSSSSSPGTFRKIVVQCLSIVVMAIGSLTLAQYGFSVDLGIDNLITGLMGYGVVNGRMAAITAGELTLMGAGLLLWDTETRKGFPVAQPIMIGVATIALMALLGYAYGGIPTVHVGSGIQIAIPTAVSLVALSIGVLSLSADRGWMSALLSNKSGGVLARRMLPFLFIVPACLGALRQIGTNFGGYSPATLTSLTAVLTMLAFALVTARAADALNLVDQRRDEIERDRAALARQKRIVLVNQHAKSKEDARALSQEQLKAKDEVLSHVSHELRTPLTAAHQFVAILLDGIAGDLKEEQREYLEIVLRNLKQLQAMIGDLLDTARARGGKLTVDAYPLEVLGLVNDLFRILRSPAAEKGITLDLVQFEVPVVWADATRVCQILTNLIENAIKFADGGAIIVSASADQSDPGFVRISVSDRGPGIPPQSTERIFERLFQIDAELDSGRKGLGLGLYICRELAARMGGRLWVESRLGYGSTFFLTLPVFAGQKASPHLKVI
ncbi:MAG: HAMP domain-containing histidine kinase [Gemmatimonadota bacterium]|nr:HAMP domain-containing histidine kinase [Gemmatimonadota bacterium]